MTAVLESLAGVLLTLSLHATVLLSLVWLAERTRLLRHPGWAELAWRGALFGALLSTALAHAPGSWPVRDAVPAAPALASALAPTPVRLVPLAVSAPAPGPAPATASAPNRQDRSTTVSVVESEPTLPVSMPKPAIQSLLALWLSGLALGALWRVRQWRAVHRLGRYASGRGRDASPVLRQRATALAAELGMPLPQLRVVPGTGSPLILPDRRVLLPAWCEGLDRDQQRALLAHEFAHLQRADPAWRLAQHLALLPLFFHPLAWWARTRLEALSEDACDARAVAVVGSGRPLAECLAECLSRAPAQAPPRWAVAMAGESGSVVRRVQRLIEESPMKLSSVSPFWRRSALVLGLAVLLVLPAIAVIARDGNGTSVSIHSDADGENFKATIRQPGLLFRADGDGDFTTTADESDLATLGDGAEFEIAETRNGVSREIRFQSESGAITRRYRVAGKDHALDADGRAWLATAIPNFYRLTGIHAEARGLRLLAAGGPARLIAEIAQVRGDYARAEYLGVLFRAGPLDDAHLAKALALTEAMGSDFELRRALSVALEEQALSPARQAQVLVLADRLGSDFERAELLTAGVAKLGLQGASLAAWRQALDGIGSDFERRRVLEQLIEDGQPAASALSVALAAAESIGSDFEKRSVLIAAAPRAQASDEARAAYLRLAGQIGSDFETREALLALIAVDAVDAPTAGAVLAAATGIGSDFETREVLVALAAVMPADPALIEQYRAVARRLGDHERGQAEKALDRFAIAQVD